MAKIVKVYQGGVGMDLWTPVDSALSATSTNPVQNKVIYEELANKAGSGDIPWVVNNLTSTSTTNALSAAQGKILNDKISDLQAMGRFLSLWNATTWLPISFPLSTPYTYSTWDYFLVETVWTTNYKPTGASYKWTASTVVESEELAAWDMYIYDWTTWLLQINHWKEISFANISWQPSDNSALATALNNKQDTISDLATIRAWAAAWATAVQQSELSTYLDNGWYTTDSDIGKATLTITQNGTSKGTFNANAKTNETIALTDTTYSNLTSAAIQTGTATTQGTVTPAILAAALPRLSTQANNLAWVKIWVGTQANYDALSTKDSQTLYFTTDS